MGQLFFVTSAGKRRHLRLERKNVAAHAGIARLTRADCLQMKFCAGISLQIRPEQKNVAACAGNARLTRADCPQMKFCAGIGRKIRPESSVTPFCAGMECLFLRRKENCNRLRGKTVPNPPGILCGTILRRNGVSFSAQKEKL